MKRCLAVLATLIGLSIGSSAQTCTTFPCVVASVSLTDQINGIGATPLYTPPVSGIFRISAYLSVRRVDTKPNAVWNIDVLWRDDQEARQASYTISNAFSSAQSSTWVVQAVGGVPLLFKTRSMNGRVGYNLFIVVEQLQ
jgi:hypothetical protein